MGSLVNYLCKDSPNCIIGSITHKLKRKCPIRGLNDGSGGQCFLQEVKRLFAFVIKFESDVILQQVRQWKSYLAEILDETPVKTCMTKKRTNLANARSVRQCRNHINLSRVNRNSFFRFLRYNLP